MTADLLRSAAALMRERAEAATAPNHPWAVDDEGDNGVIGVRARRGAGPTVVTTVPLGYHERRANAAHIASWHPAVALAVADWLEYEARCTDRAKANYPDVDFAADVHAVDVARAYLNAL